MSHTSTCIAAIGLGQRSKQMLSPSCEPYSRVELPPKHDEVEADWIRRGLY